MINNILGMLKLHIPKQTNKGINGRERDVGGVQNVCFNIRLAT